MNLVQFAQNSAVRKASQRCTHRQILWMTALGAPKDLSTSKMAQVGTGSRKTEVALDIKFPRYEKLPEVWKQKEFRQRMP